MVSLVSVNVITVELTPVMADPVEIGAEKSVVVDLCTFSLTFAPTVAVVGTDVAIT